MAAAVSVQSLTKRFGRTAALDDVTFDIPAGSLFGLLGPNGAGKTTLFSVAAGFLKATAGRVSVLDVDVTEEQIARLRGRYSMLPQDAAFQAGIPVIEQLVMFARLTGFDGAGAREAAQRALDLVGLGAVAKRSARALSHGMMKRVALCQAFLGDPEVVFLDEPTSGLDPENARNVRNLIRGWRGKKTVVLSSHDLAEVQELCDQVAILDHGKLVEIGTTADVTASGTLLRLSFGAPVPEALAQALRAIPSVTAVDRHGDLEVEVRLSLPSPDARDGVVRRVLETLLAHGAVPRSLREGASLEARFLEITRR